VALVEGLLPPSRLLLPLPLLRPQLLAVLLV
jgi:hypothetical protein